MHEQNIFHVLIHPHSWFFKGWEFISGILILYSTVLTPFMGVGSEAYGAVVNGRKAIGVELKPAYFRQAVRNMDPLDRQKALL